MPVPPSIMDHPFYNDDYNFSMNKLIDVLRDMSFRISTLEEDNKRLFNRVQILENEVLDNKIDLI